METLDFQFIADATEFFLGEHSDSQLNNFGDGLSTGI